MRILIEATVLGATARTVPAKDGKPEMRYADVSFATDAPAATRRGDVSVGQNVSVERVADSRLVDEVLAKATLPAPFLLVAEQQTYGETTRTTIIDVRPPLTAKKAA